MSRPCYSGESDRDAFTDGRVGWTNLEAHYESGFEGPCQAFQRCDARAVLA